jgi:hypothetical protein
VRHADLAAREERVLRFDPVDEAVLDEEIQRAIDGGRRDAAALRLELREQVVRADRPLRGQHAFVDLTAAASASPCSAANASARDRPGVDGR